ncbi:ATP-binding protein [Actinomadura macrotermitis]|uniref:Histidine kinase/HSP90-like ATPase domain-containing protein n=1 Tax=Actinomadura macrotermitis TaxID=2585200 RepID=A0A7K0BWQ7_9ACTN|nr:ATP-binding protein [Actinomadura macrotermitis]MQY05598.1 hypothetical protein [Actinomadura macrotermitis]
MMAEETFERAMIATPSAVGLLRDLAEAHLRKWGLCALVDDALLVASELITNAVRARPRSLIGFRLVRQRAVLRIEVYDTSPGRAVITPSPDGGRGLVIVEALAREWGQRAEPAGGKSVYALLDLPVS